MSSLQRHGALAAALLLAGCAAISPTSPPSESPARPWPEPAQTDPAADAFFRSQVEQATLAETRGHWAAAALAWEAANLVRPEDIQTQARLAEVHRRVEAISAARLAAAETAQGRGDWDEATQAYLDVLALVPTHRGAAEALRQVERQRARRALVGRLSRMPATGRRAGADRRPSIAEGDDRTRSNNTLREHATLLASQGDLDGAIQLLRDALGRSDADTRALLVDTYVQKAASLKDSQPEAARVAVEAALGIDRRHPGAVALQRQLARPQTGSPRPGSAATATGR